MNKPVKKFPTGKCVNIYNVISFIEKKYKIDFDNLNPGVPTRNKYHDFNFHDFLSEKCIKNVKFPLTQHKDISDDPRNENFIGKESVVEIPISYDSKHDLADHMEKKIKGKEKLLSMMKQIGFKSKKEEKDFEDNMEKHIDFGQSDYTWANKVLDLIYKEFKEFYINGKLRLWYPCDWGNQWLPEGVVEYKYPHELDAVGNEDTLDGIYYFSDIVNYIEKKYGIKDDKFYEFIIYNNYIEGRYWERVLSIDIDEKTGKLSRKLQFPDIGHGMKATKNIDHMLNIIEKDFRDAFSKSEYRGQFPIYMDVYKKVKPQ